MPRLPPHAPRSFRDSVTRPTHGAPRPQARFLAEYEGKKPVILVGATADWPAREWSLAGFEGGNSTLAAVSIPAHGYLKGGEEPYMPAQLVAAGKAEGAELPLAALLGGVVFLGPAVPLELRKRKMVIDPEGLAASPALQDGYRLHPAFAHWNESGGGGGVGGGGVGGSNLLKQLRLVGNRWVRDLQRIVRGHENPRPLVWKDRFLITGPAGGGSCPHIDIEHQSFWNGLVHDRKRWVFIDKPHLAAMERHDAGAVAGWSTAGMTALDWYTEWYPKVSAPGHWGQPTASSTGSSGGGGGGGDEPHELWECYQEPGDVVYGPGGMMHAVLSLEDSLVLSEQMMFPSDLAGAVPI
eukprot:SAG22_NODE_4140_length_1369_cov_1.014961_2_plen_352_part_01